MGRGSKNKGKNQNDNTTVYLKVLATYQCSKENCKRVWHSAHAWEREDNEGICCEFCGQVGELVDVVDEILKLDTYKCPNESCDNQWQAIHDGQGLQQECDVCSLMVSPDKTPQERFGRHYTFKCKNKACQGSQWEDFSTEIQKGQRCTKCHSRGDIKKVQKLRPRWLVEKMRRNKLLRGQGGDGSGEDGTTTSSKIIGLGMGKGPSKHNSEFCDMCQDIRRQNVARSCHQFHRVVCATARNVDGSVSERITNIG